MPCRSALAIGVSCVLGACGGPDAGTTAARAAFDRFQDALFAADATAVRRLVTEESLPVVEAMPWDRVQKQQRLVVEAASDARGSYHVSVRDPNRDAARGTYVVVRENGRYVVDLVATAGLAAVPTGTTTTAPVEPRQLTPEDFDEIRRRELATPPGEPVR